jgi:hypothetical protein
VNEAWLSAADSTFMLCVCLPLAQVVGPSDSLTGEMVPAAGKVICEAASYKFSGDFGPITSKQGRRCGAQVGCKASCGCCWSACQHKKVSHGLGLMEGSHRPEVANTFQYPCCHQYVGVKVEHWHAAVVQCVAAAQNYL